MGGIRTAGDLVARLQLNRGMRIDAAKKYVAEKLGVSVLDLGDTIVMSEDAVAWDGHAGYDAIPYLQKMTAYLLQVRKGFGEVGADQLIGDL